MFAVGPLWGGTAIAANAEQAEIGQSSGRAITVDAHGLPEYDKVYGFARLSYIREAKKVIQALLDNGALLIPPFSVSYPDVGSLDFPGYKLQTGFLWLLHGGNGSGKTTFLRHLMEGPGEGKHACFLMDQSYEPLLFQYKPVWWNIALPLIATSPLRKKEARALAEKALAPFNFDITLLDRYPSSLSGGQKHLVIVARLALSSHPVLLLDEPLAGIDCKRADAFWDIVAGIVRGHDKILLASSHERLKERNSRQTLTFQGFQSEDLTISCYPFDGGSK